MTRVFDAGRVGTSVFDIGSGTPASVWLWIILIASFTLAWVLSHVIFPWTSLGVARGAVLGGLGFDQVVGLIPAQVLDQVVASGWPRCAPNF